MKILQLCLRVPFPARDGGTMAMTSLADGLLLNGVELHMFALNTSKHFVDQNELNEASKKYPIYTVPIDNRITPIGAFTNLLGNEPYHVSRFFSENVASSLRQLLQSNTYDAVVFESVFMAPYLDLVKAHSNATTILRSHNIEYRIWERLIAAESNLLKKYYINLQMERLKRYEIEMTGAFDWVAAITPVDQTFYETNNLSNRVFYLPFGMDVSNKKISLPHHAQGLRIGFLGSMDWIPNQEGIRWFVKEVWPKMAEAHPNVTCEIRGHHMPEDLMGQSSARLLVGGRVENATEFFESLDVSIVPLKSGSGVRIKVLECMALGIPVIATKVGYEGVEGDPGKSILEANTVQDFVANIGDLLKEPSRLVEIAERAQGVIRDRYGKQKCAASLLAVLSPQKITAS